MRKKKEKLPEFFWNHRVVQYPDGSFGIHEAYYTDAKSTEEDPGSITLDAVPIHGESTKELKETLARVRRALKKPTLKYRKYVKKKDDNKLWK